MSRDGSAIPAEQSAAVSWYPRQRVTPDTSPPVHNDDTYNYIPAGRLFTITIYIKIYSNNEAQILHQQLVTAGSLATLE